VAIVDRLSLRTRGIMSTSTDKELLVRPIREGDVERIIQIDELVGSSRPASWWRGLLDLYADRDSDSSERLNHTLCQVAVKDGKILGFILGDIQAWQFGVERCGRVVAIGVDPAHSRRGVGSALLGALRTTFRARQLHLVQCLVRPGDPLHQFFSANGFGPSELEVLEQELKLD
jgi:ribosomal protein S18 acetylase RimI-like enzyme